MKEKFPVTTGIRFLRSKKAVFEQHIYDYEEKGGTHQTSIELGINEHAAIKTIVFHDENDRYFLCLMHGDKKISQKELARQIGCRQVIEATQEQALKKTGYLFGGTGPFGTKTQLPVYVQKTIFDLEKIYINGGKRGFILEMPPSELSRVLENESVDVAIDD